MKSQALGLLLALSLLSVANAEAITGRVVGVSDGDSITVLDTSKVKHKIRLSGIDAPERSQPFGQRSKQSLSDLVFAQWVTVDTDKVDRYVRAEGKVLKDGLDANLEMVKRGLAWHYKEYQGEQTAADREAYARAEDAAKGQRVGLWKDGQPVAPWDFRKEVRESRSNVKAAHDIH